MSDGGGERSPEALAEAEFFDAGESSDVLSECLAAALAAADSFAAADRAQGEAPPLPPPPGKPPREATEGLSLEPPTDSALVPASGDLSLASVGDSGSCLAQQPTSLGGTQRWAAWIRSLSREEIDDMSTSFAKWKAAEMQW